MMKIWEQTGVDELLRKAYKENIILSGLSAGSICWFIAGHSDSEFYENKENPKNIWVKGLGILPFLHCPHYDEPERKGFDAFVGNQITDSIALENNVALVVIDDKYSIIKADQTKNAYLLTFDGESTDKKVLEF